MGKEEFRTAQNDYKKAREKERRELADFLADKLGEDEQTKDKLYAINSPRAGKGRTKYTSGGRIWDYDLSNWKWVEITDDCDFDCIVSLNVPDVDPRSGYSHILFDRVGLLVSYHKDSHYYETTIYTDIDLPLDDAKKEKIAQLVLDQYKIFRERAKE